MKPPEFWIIAGPNGAGKSTLSARLAYRWGDIPIVNPDVIAVEIDPARKNERTVQVHAGRLAIRQRERYLKEGRSFAVETTLSGSSSIKLMARARELGYRTNLIYIGLDSAMVSFIRVQTRVRDGGHSVPDQLLQGRYYSSMANLATAIGLADRSWILDNSARRQRFLIRRLHSQTIVMVSRLPNWATEWIPEQFL